jgi:predicted porin
LANAAGANGDSQSTINTGLLPSWLGITGKKRENNLDISWTISFQPGASATKGLSGGSGGGEEDRQANITFGDKSWGSIKVGLDIGVFGRDAILNDMTLLGVGSTGLATGNGSTTTLGRIGTGFLYTDFTGQVNYTSPDWNGFQFVAGIRQPWVTNNLAGGLSAAATGNQESPGYEGIVSYSWAGDFSGKVWGEAMGQQVDGIAGTAQTSDDVSVFGLGASVNFAGFNLVGYYYDGEGVGTTGILSDGFAAGTGRSRDSDGGYVQAKYKLPTGTTLGLSWGQSNLDLASGEAASTLVQTNEMWTVGAYHALTSNLNLVAEYSNVTAENHLGAENETSIFDIGAILFF